MWSVRNGAFLTKEGARVLDALSRSRFDDLDSSDLLFLSCLLGCSKPPSKDRMISTARNVQHYDDQLDYEVRMMDAIRDAYGASVRRTVRNAAAVRRPRSDISEFTTAGSVFSRNLDAQ
tara:strand:- start:120 stop:476 length:357 start_codon:yes stop_codon:yes gene_type:complete